MEPSDRVTNCGLRTGVTSVSYTHLDVYKRQDLSFGSLLERLGIPHVPSGRDIRVHFGGPVERGRGFVLHSHDYQGGPATMKITGGYGMTATLDVLEAMAHGAGPARALLALGYAGWGPGPVSYTHLDVYKRQAFRHQGQSDGNTRARWG